MSGTLGVAGTDLDLFIQIKLYDISLKLEEKKPKT
jgi:hypothetical protein